MSQNVNVQEKALAIAKVREEQRIEKTQELFLSVVQKRLNSLAKECKSFQQLEFAQEDFNNIPFKRLQKVANELGFFIKEQTEQKIINVGISILIKQDKKTKAELMLEEFNLQLSKNKEEEIKKIEQSCIGVLQALLKGAFASEYCEGKGYWAIIAQETPKFSEAKIEAKKYMKERGFEEIFFEDGKWHIFLGE